MNAPTKAQRRVLLKASAAGLVMRAGGFSGASAGDTWKEPMFDRPVIIDRLIAAGLLGFGDGFNQYILTDAGMRAAAKFPRKESAADIAP